MKPLIFIAALVLSIPAMAANVDLPIKAKIVRCVTCAEATNMCQSEKVCCQQMKEKCDGTSD